MNKHQELTLSVSQHVATPCDIEASLTRIEKQLTQCTAKNSDLLLVPEASLTGYNIQASDAAALAIPKDSDTTDRLRTLCQQQQTALAYGYIENDHSTLYNSVHVIDAQGNSVAHYRKTHLWGDLDRRLFEAGDSFSDVFELNGWHLGLLICYDVEFPECVRHMALQGAELLLVPTALMTPWTFVADHMIRARAAENQLYLAYANYCGQENAIEYVGLSAIIDPTGELLANADDKPQMLTASLKKDVIKTIRASVPYHADRRPDLYRKPI